MTSLWNSALTRLSSKVTSQTYEMWLRPIECARIEGTRIVLRAPNQYVRLWFESNYLPSVLEEMRQEDNRDFHVEFEVQEASARTATLAERPAPLDEPFVDPSVASAPTEPAITPGLNPKYRFDSFVAGPSNQLAHAAARAATTR